MTDHESSVPAAILGRGFVSVEDFQRHHRLPETGVVDRPTARAIDAPRFCGLPDRMNLGRVCLWGKRKLTCSWNGQLDGISTDAAVAAVRHAWGLWEAVCGIQVEVVTGAEDVDIVVVTKRLDGAAGVLAQAELPCGQHRRRSVEVDSTEPWVTILDPPRYRVSLPLTLSHEFGHSIGLEHGPPGSLMQATYSAAIKRPQAWDVAEAQERYGVPVAPKPEPTEPGEPTEFITIPSFKLPKGWIL